LVDCTAQLVDRAASGTPLRPGMQNC